MKKLILSILLMAAVSLANAQQRCASTLMESQRQKVEAMQQAIENYKKRAPNSLRMADEIVKIPVVVHIIHNTVSGKIGGPYNTNISDDQVISQIRVLNEDYRKAFGTSGYNNNPAGADMQIEFFLAQLSPDNLPTSGITRHYSPENSFDVFTDLEKISSLAYWPADRYLNIWVVNLDAEYLGYGEFPAAEIDGLDPIDPKESTDGVFIDFKVFGRKTGTATGRLYSFGRTLTHEIGHWLGLIHTWGDSFCGTDYCEDTPQSEHENNSETCDAMLSHCADRRGSLNMIENYMDYTPDSCMNVFTTDQKERVRAVLELSKRRRRLILNSQFLIPVQETTQLKLLSHNGLNSDLQLQILLPDFQDFTLKFYDMWGHLVLSKLYKDYPSTVLNVEELNLPKGNLIVKLNTNNKEITKRILNL